MIPYRGLVCKPWEGSTRKKCAPSTLLLPHIPYLILGFSLAKSQSETILFICQFICGLLAIVTLPKTLGREITLLIPCFIYSAWNSAHPIINIFELKKLSEHFTKTINAKEKARLHPSLMKPRPILSERLCDEWKRPPLHSPVRCEFTVL